MLSQWPSGWAIVTLVHTAFPASTVSTIHHADTPSLYDNEEDIAMGIAASGVPRENIFLTSKLAPREQGYDGTLFFVNLLVCVNSPFPDLINSQKCLLLSRRQPRNLEPITWIFA